MDVLDWIEKAKDFNSVEFLNDFAFDIIEDEESVQIQKDQWEKGHSVKGEEIGFYEIRTEKLSGGRKKRGELWDLNNTGDFWAKTYLGTKIQPRKKDIIFDYGSDGVNKRKLFTTIRKYALIDDPYDIFGLSNPFIDKLNELIEPKFINQLNEYYNV